MEATIPMQYISTMRTVLYSGARGASQSLVLIYGDEVSPTASSPENGRTEVPYRGRSGWIDSEDLMEEHPCEIYFIDGLQHAAR